jgi:hypothetical protein
MTVAVTLGCPHPQVNGNAWKLGSSNSAHFSYPKGPVPELTGLWHSIERLPREMTLITIWSDVM